MVTDKITYLMGAGASANCIPVVENFNQGVEDMLGKISALDLENLRFSGFDEQIPLTKAQLKEKMLTECKALLMDSKKHMTIDTYAKKLFLTNKMPELRKLKALISLFLIDRQLSVDVDQRYDVFFATLLSNNGTKLTIPKSLNVVTWNYDFQFELASAPFFEDGYIKQAQDNLNIYPNYKNTLATDCFQLIKLNGTAIGYMQKMDEMRYTNFEFDLLMKPTEYSTSIKDHWEKLLTFYFWTTVASNKTTFALNFAWENTPFTLQLRKYAYEAVADTTHLVVIGYSFPTFNRTLDKDILLNMKKLKRITIQTMASNSEEVEYRLRSLLGKDRMKAGLDVEVIKMKTGKEEFYIPFEFAGQ